METFSHLTERLLTLCGENAALVAFLGAFLESLIGLGTLLPGGTMVVLAGFTIRDQGAAGFVLVAALAWAGMTLGSVLDFWLGRLAGRRLVPERALALWRPLAAALRASRRFMRRWGWWAIFVSNLAGPGRSSIAVASGASDWSFGSFLLGQSLARDLEQHLRRDGLLRRRRGGAPAAGGQRGRRGPGRLPDSALRRPVPRQRPGTSGLRRRASASSLRSPRMRTYEVRRRVAA